MKINFFNVNVLKILDFPQLLDIIVCLSPSLPPLYIYIHRHIHISL